MKRIRLNACIGVLLTLCGAHGALNAQEATLNYLIISELSAPFQLVDDNISTGGIVTDIVEELAQRAEHTLTYTVGSTERIETIIKYGQKQPWIAYTAKVWPDLSEHYTYLEVPLFEVTHSMLTCDPNIQAVNSTGVLRGKRLAILKSFDYPEITPLANRGELSLTDIRSYEQGFDLVKFQRVHGFVEMDIRLKYNLGRYDGHEDCMHLADLRKVIAPYSIYLAVSRDLTLDATRALERTLEAMVNDTFIRNVVNRYTRY